MHRNMTSQATLHEQLAALDELSLHLLGHLLETAIEDNISLEELVRLYEAADQGGEDQSTTSFHDTAGYKALRTARQHERARRIWRWTGARR